MHGESRLKVWLVLFKSSIVQGNNEQGNLINQSLFGEAG